MIEKSFLAPFLLATAFAAILLAGCGSGKAAHTTTAATRPARARSTTLRVFFRKGATHTQESSVEQRLRRETCVRRVVFVSKAQALKIMKKKFPGLYGAGQPLANEPNPLPDSLTVTAAKLSCVPTLGGAVARWPGAAAAKWRAFVRSG